MVRRNYSQSELLKYIELDKDSDTLEDKIILLHFDSYCLGDTICFAGFIYHFIEYHKPKYIYISTFFPHLFENGNKFEFILSNTDTTLTVDKMISIGYDRDNLKHVLGGMIWATRDTMGIPHYYNLHKPPVKKYEHNVFYNKVSIAPESLKSIAKWTTEGWQSVIDELPSLGLDDVYNISYENTMSLNGVKNFNGFDNINVALSHILESRVFIGLSSGLAWLAWAYGKPVVMISRFTKEHNEFDCYRVYNKMACYGCFNTFKNIGNKCPIFLNTQRENECHKTITPEMVISQIKLAINDI